MTRTYGNVGVTGISDKKWHKKFPFQNDTSFKGITIEMVNASSSV